jgi:hypothetical protein
MPTFAFKDFTADWRDVIESTPPDRYGHVVAAAGGADFKILTVSHFDNDIDGDRALIETASRDFDDGSAYFTHITRDALIGRMITHRGRPRYVIEPGPDALDYMAAREGVSAKRLVRAAREGELGRRLSAMAMREEKRKRNAAETTIAALNGRIQELEDEIGMLVKERNHLQRELARCGAE